MGRQTSVMVPVWNIQVPSITKCGGIKIRLDPMTQNKITTITIKQKVDPTLLLFW